MALSRISDAQSFSFFVSRANRLQVDVRRLQEQIASGRRLVDVEDDPLGAAQAARFDASLAGLGQFEQSSRFGANVLSTEDKALAEAEQLMIRAEEIATQQAGSLLSAEERTAAAEEVHGLLQALTAIGNTEFAGRRVFAGLALDAPQPFADPDAPGYTAATAYSGSTQEFSVKIGSGGGERLRVTTRGDTVFGASLQALENLEAALASNGNDAGTLGALATARAGVDQERASVGARQASLLGRETQVAGVKLHEQEGRADLVDADLVKVITDLTQTQTALQALFTAQSQLTQTSLVNLLRV
jgi:flagellar hook-associated protein 3 FlgL